MRLIGLAGWKGSGKTRTARRLIAELTRRGLRVATIKHAHHEFDIDQPGKDSHTHRQAGAREVLVSSNRRWALIHELSEPEDEPTLADLVAKLAPADLVLVEGYKRGRHAKIEIYRRSLGKPMLHPDDPDIVAIAVDEALAALPIPVFDVESIEALADAALTLAREVPAPSGAGTD